MHHSHPSHAVTITAIVFLFVLLGFIIYARIWAWWKWTHKPPWPYHDEKYVARWAKKYYNADGTRNKKREIKPLK